MATMVKEKRKEQKKKTKAKPELESKDKEIFESPKIEISSKEFSQNITTIPSHASTSTTAEDQPITRNVIQENLVTSTTIDNFKEEEISTTSVEIRQMDTISSDMRHVVQNKVPENIISKDSEITNILAEARRNLEEMTLDLCTDSTVTNISDVIIEKKHDVALDTNTLPNLLCPEGIVLAEDLVIPSAPSAPIEVEAQPYNEPAPHENVPERRIPWLPLEEAVRVFGGKEIAEVKAMSKREEAIVEAGPQSGPEHPLVDLLSTFRTSLISIERERNRISAGYVDEDKSRAALWQVEKRSVNASQQCPCGVEVSVRAVYEVARLQTERMPAARLRLQALLRDVQECYCHHQHAALRAHCDIDELVAEILQSSKSSVREALLLVLQALQLSDAAPDAFAQALQRWASILSAALLDQRDWAHLLFLLHCLFRQSRSVQWAARVIELQVPDVASAARLTAVLELMLTRPLLEEAQECTEESDAWEEVDPRGEGGAVGEGRLRERDLLALLDALPLQDMVARTLLFARADITKENDQSWGDKWGGHGVLRASCGVRVLLGVLQRALCTHAGYTRLRARLRRLAAAALSALAALHLHSRHGYAPELEEHIAAQLEACFVAGVDVLREEAHAAPASLLRPHVARDYVDTLINGLHDEGPLRVCSLSLAAGAVGCALRVRTALHAALDRELDHELAATVLRFLMHVGIKGARVVCKGACDVTARQLLPLLLVQHRLHTHAFHILADFYQVEAIDPSLLQPLAPQQWRPTPGEARALLDDWAARCSPLVQHLLLQLDYTPHTGVSLDSQLLIGAWLCAWLRPRGDAPEWAWQVLRALRVHRTQWGAAPEAPPAEEAQDLLSAAYALMASDWGHCIPLVCGAGAEALARVAALRPADAVRCAGLIMRVMAHSPESVSLTPKFAEVFTAIVSSGPSLVQRALGRRASSGADLLQQLLLEHVRDTRMSKLERSALLSAWLHALWRLSVPAGARGVLDAAVRACCDWRTLDAYAVLLLQEQNYKEYLSDAVRNVCSAPLLCEALLRAAHALEVQTQLHARLVTELARQRAAAQRIHVDNALKLLDSPLTADELTVHRCASAALAAPLQHPAHLLLWRLLLHMFLQRPPAAPPDSPPVGPLFFSGLVKSRTLAQLKKRLQEAAIYHKTQAETLKTSETNTASPNASTSSKEQTHPTSEGSLFSTLAIFDLTGASDSDESSSERDGDSDDEGARETSVDRDTFNLVCYHTAAEKIVREYLVWLEEGAKVRAMPHHADVARFLSEQALATAWRASLSSATSPIDSPAAPPPACEPYAARAHTTHTVRAVADVASLKRRRYKVPALPAIKDETYFRDAQLVVRTVQKLLTELEKLAKEWAGDVQRARTCDAQLWELVGRLRVRRPLPPVRKACPHNCKPVTIHIAKDEWCISSGAEQGIQENRRRARAAIRQLSRPRPQDARTTSRLQYIARRIRSQACALRVAELAASAALRTQGYPPAHDAVCALVADIAARFISADATLATAYLERWSSGGDAQRKLCLMLVDPPRLRAREWPALYAAVLRLSLPPHVTFSYISKFELSAWADAVDEAQRDQLLEALLQAAQRMSPEPDDQHLMLLELLGVHSSCAARAPELCAHVLRCARACAACALPPPYLRHLPEIVDRYGEGLDFDQLGNLLRELGVLLWSARSSARAGRALFASYAPHFAATLRALLRQFVAAAVRRTYQPERVAAYAWSALQESWSAWVAPHCSAPLLPSTADAEAYTDMLTRFRDTITMVMQDCPGSEDALLRLVFQWVVQSYLSAEPQWPQEARVQTSALLATLSALPWPRQWFTVDLLKLTLQMSRSTEHELTSWCGACLQHLQSDAWMQGAAHEQLAPTLADLLEIFTSPQLSLPSQTLEQACRLPWSRLPEPALSVALQRYFADHHSPAAPYHHAPHFRVLLSACQLLPPVDAGESPHAHAHALAAACEKRAHAVSQWVRAASVPALCAHVPAHAQCLLDTLTDLAPHIGAEELTQLLSRAVVIMCVEPAAARALPVWVRWVGTCPAAARRAAASAAATLTTLDYFAALGDAVARAVLAERESAGWSVLIARWAECAWWEGGALVSRGALHAAYAMLHARAHSHAHLRHALDALLAADINFAHDEAVVGVWVCVAARAAAACGAAARALLSRWAEQRRTLLQVVTLSAPDSCPTPQHRLLCRLALCIVSPSEANVKAYEAACSPLLGNTDAMAWGRSPRVDLLPRLAVRLYPHHEVYFKEELQLTANLVQSDDNR